MRVALFVTCLVDLYRPNVAFSAIALLEAAGCNVVLPRAQTCCGQPAYNSGDRATAQALALSVMDAFAGFEGVIVPSGSCAGMIVKHFPALFPAGSAEQERALELATRTFELTAFLATRAPLDIATTCPGTVTYHDGCSGLRELGVRDQPRALLRDVAGVQVVELADPEVCCGFGGTFCVKYPDISTRMVTDKVRDIVATGADTVLAGDLGCLLNIAGRLRREGSAIQVRHVAEVLAGRCGEAPPIGETP
jgi:L-lactate dehydrogenase complex protein LldE